MIGSTNARTAGGGGGTYQAKQVTPSNSTQLVTPDTGYDALSSVTVNAIDEIPNLSPENIKQGVHILDMVGTWNAFPSEPSGGLYFSDDDENGYPRKCTIYNWKRTGQFPLTFNNTFWNKLEEIEFVNSDVITRLPEAFVFNMSTLKRLVLPNSLTEIHGGASQTSTEFGGCTALKTLILPEGIVSIGGYSFWGMTALATLYIPASVTVLTGTDWAISQIFANCTALEFVTLGNGFNCNNLKLSTSTRYSAETIVSWFEALADRTGQQTYTLTIGTTNLNKLTAEQRAIATNKNWTLA